MQPGSVIVGGPTRPKSRAKPKVRPEIATRLDRALVSKARMIASHHGVALGKLLSDSLRPVIDRAYRRMLSDLDANEARPPAEG